MYLKQFVNACCSNPHCAGRQIPSLALNAPNPVGPVLQRTIVSYCDACNTVWEGTQNRSIDGVNWQEMDTIRIVAAKSERGKFLKLLDGVMGNLSMPPRKPAA